MLTDEQRAIRRQYIGSSDAAAILGLDPYRSAADVWLDKTGQVDDAAENEAMEAGTLLERAVLDWAEKSLGLLERDVLLIHPNGLLCANLDARITIFGELVEAKTTGITGPPNPGYGEPGTDQVPDRVVIQVHHQFACCTDPIAIAYVPVLIGGRGFVMYEVQRNQELVKEVVARGSEFMDGFVRRKRRPDDFKPSLEVLKRIRREPGMVVPVASELVESWTAKREARLKAEADEKAAQTALIAAMGQGDGAAFNGGLVTYLPTNRKGYTVAPTTYRSLRLKESKAVAKPLHIGAA